MKGLQDFWLVSRLEDADVGLWNKAGATASLSMDDAEDEDDTEEAEDGDDDAEEQSAKKRRLSGWRVYVSETASETSPLT